MERRGDFWISRLPCPGDGDVAEMHARQQEASQIFHQLCPPAARVVDVYGLRGAPKVNCGYEVTYQRIPGFDNIDGPQLVHEIEFSKPNNSEIVRKLQLFPPGLRVTYKIPCRCPRLRRRGKFEVKDEFDSVDGIRINLDNLKVEKKELE